MPLFLRDFSISHGVLKILHPKPIFVELEQIDGTNPPIRFLYEKNKSLYHRVLGKYQTLPWSLIYVTSVDDSLGAHMVTENSDSIESGFYLLMNAYLEQLLTLLHKTKLVH